MKAGKLDRRIKIKSSTFAQDAYGEDIATESTLATVWARLMTQLPSEVFAAGSDQTSERVIFQIRKRSDVLETHVVEYSGNRFEITGIQEVGRNNRLNLTCERQGDNV